MTLRESSLIYVVQCSIYFIRIERTLGKLGEHQDRSISYKEIDETLKDFREIYGPKTSAKFRKVHKLFGNVREVT